MSPKRDTGCASADRWADVAGRFDAQPVELGQHWSYNLRQDPKRLAFVLSRYKFAARLACEGRRVLELGCSEGLGAPILSEAATCYVGVDLDAEAVAHAEANFADQGRSFLHADLLGQRFGTFDAVISMDVVEHIDPGCEDLFFRCVFENLGEDGIAVIGTPNVTAEAYASEASRQGHVNLMDAERLTAALGRVFHNVFIFSMNDEVVHTGFRPMAHFLLGLGVYKRKEMA